MFGIDDVIGVGADLIGGAIGSAFGDDQPQSGYNKEYGEQARRMMFGSKVGQRRAMGDPSVDAYWRSMLKTDPDKAQEFINDFGADFKGGEDIYGYAALPGDRTRTTGENAFLGALSPVTLGGGGGMFPSYTGNPRATEEWKLKQESNRANSERVLDQTLNRLSHGTPETETSNYGYSGFSGDGFGNTAPAKAAGFNRPTGNKYARLNKERETGSFFY